jgi:hypothetical protein
MKDSPGKTPTVRHVAGFSPLLQSVKDSLCNQISEITQSGIKTATVFVEQVDAALLEHRLIKEMASLEAAKMAEILKLATNAKLAANALEKMDGTTARVIMQNVRKLADPDIEAEIANLRSIATTAQKYFGSIVRSRPRGNALSPEHVSLISKIAKAYAMVFGIRPSYAEGRFAKVVRSIFQSSDIGKPPEKSALKRVLEGIDLGEMPPLRRGRKSISK